jgi:hypothetical protein
MLQFGAVIPEPIGLELTTLFWNIKLIENFVVL